MTQDARTLTRRDAIRNAVLLVGGAISAAELRFLESALAATGDETAGRFLSGDQLAMVERVADIIMPETDTPGAVSAGVHRFIDVMLEGWASPDTQRGFVGELAYIERRAAEFGMQSFLQGSPEQQFRLVELLDREAFAAGNEDAFFRRFKKLILFAYFSSEPGATETLRYDRIPGDYVPCLSLESDDRAWFWLGHSYGL